MTTAARSCAVLLPALLLGTLLANTAAADRDMPQPSPPIYQAIDLGTLGGAAAGLALNAHGIVVGDSYTTGDPGAPAHAFVWEDLNGNGSTDPGEMVDLGTLGGPNSSAVGVNDQDQIVGSADTAATDPDGTPITHAALWQRRPGGWFVTDLGTLGGDSSYAVAVNNSGVILGEAQIADQKWLPCVWRGGPAQRVRTRNGRFGSVNALNDSNVIAGTLTVGKSQHAGIAAHGTVHDLDRKLGRLRWVGSNANAISSNGSVLLSLFGPDPRTTRETVLWRVGQRPVPIAPPGIAGIGRGVNDSGQVVGLSGTPSSDLYFGITRWDPFYWDAATGSHSLNDLVTADCPFDLEDAEAIASDGSVAATGYDPRDESYHAILLVPLPPGTASRRR